MTFRIVTIFRVYWEFWLINASRQSNRSVFIGFALYSLTVEISYPWSAIRYLISFQGHSCATCSKRLQSWLCAENYLRVAGGSRFIALSLVVRLVPTPSPSNDCVLSLLFLRLILPVRHGMIESSMKVISPIISLRFYPWCTHFQPRRGHSHSLFCPFFSPMLLMTLFFRNISPWYACPQSL